MIRPDIGQVLADGACSEAATAQPAMTSIAYWASVQEASAALVGPLALLAFSTQLWLFRHIRTR
jgi:hypothetical protein